MMNFLSHPSMTKCVIPDSIRLNSSDFNNAFNSMTNLNSALISNKITNMSFIFNGCTNLTSKPVCSKNVIDMSGAYVD